jgi:polyisoprenoid-binding protein YceI
MRSDRAELGKDPWGNDRLGFSADTKLNRKDFGLTWNVALESGGWLVSDEIKVHAEIQAVPTTEDARETAEAETSR